MVALFLPPPWRGAIWSIALAWMGTACIVNSRHCDRTHCRHGPHYLVMIVPVLAFAAGIVPAEFFGWLTLGIIIVTGSKFIWWATERAWDRYS